MIFMESVILGKQNFGLPGQLSMLVEEEESRPRDAHSIIDAGGESSMVADHRAPDLECKVELTMDDSSSLDDSQRDREAIEVEWGRLHQAKYMLSRQFEDAMRQIQQVFFFFFFERQNCHLNCCTRVHIYVM